MRTIDKHLCLSVFVSMAVSGCLGAAAGAAAGAEEGVDIGLFARVLTSDPPRREGAKAGRLDEFRAEDAFLTAEIALDESGHYLVPAASGGKTAIGLEWAERRVIRELALPFPAGTPVPSAEQVPMLPKPGRC